MLSELGAGKGIFGNAILSRFPIKIAEAVPLPVLVEEYPKGCLRAVVAHPQGDILCYSVHLEACSGFDPPNLVSPVVF